ncbi:TonB-dependent siderophore receptor [Aeromonas rivipollensis]|uniref:TonB-dependent siderophore receptor n=1 Tax=Aeromonas rivipollensis TaxID=948519 RepID=UPI00259F4E0E|nr:TonB-dependent siderophore receptor [Aeromonas rivipollensis]MDM5084009.1 TonB-dependent siderophore receptor [Aeromonas rivipollensis]MDM5097709.1 TonB-dependent siderophore receptor [Aeromonas rivipollensis]MDM5104805.1 TonB-dependent siderophore receptor [Aeromonas rivipollensis]
MQLVHPPLTVVAATISTLLAGSVLAAEPTSQDAALADETLTVLGQTYRNTATKTRLDPIETPQAISVVEGETLEQRGVSSVSEALRYVPGVNTELRGGAVNRLDLFNIRGFDNYQNFYDGLLLQYNEWNLQPQIDAVAIEQLEVFKGPTSVLYGSMPPGGMVNLIAKRPQRESNHSVSVATGTGTLKEMTLDSTGAINDQLAYRVVGLARQKEGQAVTSEEERYVFAPSLDWQLGKRTLLNLNLYYQKDPEAGIYTTVPASGSVKSNPLGQLGSDSFLGDQNWNEYNRDVTLLGYKLSHDFNGNWQVLQNARYMDASAYQRNTYNAALAADNRTLARNAYLTDEASKGFVIDNQLAGKVMTGPAQHNLLLGVDYQYLDARILYQDTLDYSAPAIDIFNPDHNQIRPDALAFSYEDRKTIRQSQTGVYLQDQVRLDRLVAIGGARYDSYRMDTDSRGLYLGAASQSLAQIDQDNLSFRLGALYELDYGLSPYVSYAESFEPVPGADKSGKAFDPSTGHQWEGGLKFLSEDMSKTATISAFHITKENALVTDPDNVYGPKLQTGEIVSKGIELEGRADLTSRLDLALSYTRQDMEITRDTTDLQGKTPVWVPRQMASLWSNYQAGGSLEGMRVGAGLRYVGEAQLDAANTDTVPDYLLMDMSASYDLAALSARLKGVGASLSASNLLNKTYYSCYDQNNCWFGAERNVEARLKYVF